jgi:hypothetical protein
VNCWDVFGLGFAVLEAVHELTGLLAAEVWGWGDDGITCFAVIHQIQIVDVIQGTLTHLAEAD